MNLHYVEIKNFRSIQDETIYFEPSCRTLVGINESGKSNILKALKLLGDEFTPTKSDKREKQPNEDFIEESYIRFIFKLSKQETEEVYNVVKSEILTNNFETSILKYQNKDYSLEELCQNRDEGLYRVDITEETKGARYWTLNNLWKINGNWKSPSDSCPSDYKITHNDEELLLKSFKVINPDEFDIPSEYLAPLKLSVLSELVGSAIINLVKNNKPEVIFWDYDEANLLPGSVVIDSFANNPDSIIPLKNMFLLAGIGNDQIGSKIREAQNEGNNQFQNFLDSIALKTTNHFRDVWKEYDNISFSLRERGTEISPGITESNTHDFERRSDGFKRFITFLLLISTQVKIGELKNTLIIIDEPEIGLHPTGVRFLRDELIKISKSNNVIFSTHSIFMIDPGNVSRHLIISKENEITNVKEANESNFNDEEVIYNALGFTTFDVLKEKNIIFEGWKDKKLFYTAIPHASRKTQSKLENIGKCHAKGASSVLSITPVLELAQKECLIISDNDKPALEEKKKFKKVNGYGKWYTYQDIDSNIIAVTGEDFIKDDLILKSVNHIGSQNNLKIFKRSDFSKKTDKIEQVKKWLYNQNYNSNQAKKFLSEVKDYIFDNLTAENIDLPAYKKLMNGLVTKLS